MATISLTTKINNPTIVCSFYNVGLSSSISLEYLIEKLPAKAVGDCWFPGLPAIIFIYKNRISKPINLFYEKTHNLLFLQSIINPRGFEWQLKEVLTELQKKVKPKEIIILDGLEVGKSHEPLFFVHNGKKTKNLQKAGAKILSGAIITGPIASCLISEVDPFTGVFAAMEEIEEETTSFVFPSGETAVDLVQFLNRYLGLSVDTEDLSKKSKKLHDELIAVVKEMYKTQQQKPSYLG